VARGKEREALLRVTDQLCSELGCGDDSLGPAPLFGAGVRAATVALEPEDEAFAFAIRQSLARLAANAAGESQRSLFESAVAAALDGAEMVVRGELVRGQGEHLPALLPSFILLVTLPIIEHDEALALSQRASELIEETLGK
jgi:hypothetical protein